MAFGSWVGSSLNGALVNSLIPRGLLKVHSSPLKVTRTPFRYSPSYLLPSSCPETTIQVPWSLSASFAAVSFGPLAPSRKAIAHAISTERFILHPSTRGPALLQPTILPTGV